MTSNSAIRSLVDISSTFSVLHAHIHPHRIYFVNIAYCYVPCFLPLKIYSEKLAWPFLMAAW